MVSLDEMQKIFESFIGRISKSKGKILEKRDIDSFRPLIELLREKGLISEAKKLSKVAVEVSKNRKADDKDEADLRKILKKI